MLASPRRVHYGAHMSKQKSISLMLDGLSTDFVKAFSEPARVEILKHLITLGPSDVKTLAEKMPQHRSVISRHLSVLYEAGFLDYRKDGRRAVYSVDGTETLRMSEEMTNTIRKCLDLGCC